MTRTDLSTGATVEVDADFNSKNEVSLEETNENELYEKMIPRILENIANFQQLGSNWQFVVINQLEIHLVDYVPMSGSSYIPLDSEIANTKSVINIKNQDDQCLKWCSTRHFNPVEKNVERVTKELKKQSEKFDLIFLFN